MRTLPQNHTVICFTVLALALTGTLCAQTDGGLSGKVVDSAGEPLRGVKIVVTALDKPGFKEQAKTDKRGVFLISPLDPGVTYEVRLQKKKFAPMAKEITFEKDSTTVHEFTLLTPAEAEEAQKALVLQQRESLGAFNAGVEAFMDGELETAKVRIEEALELGYDPEATYSALCLVFFKMESYEEAAAAAEKTLALNAEEPRGLMIRYQAYKALGEEEKAAAAAAALSAAGVNHEMAMMVFNEGVAAYNSGRSAAAKAKFREARDLDASIPEIHRVLGSIAMAEGRYGDAGKTADKILDLVPGDAEALKMRFDACRQALNFEDLGTAASELAAVDPGYVGSSLESQADTVFEANKVDVARSLLDALLEVLPDYARAYYRLGLCDVNAGDNAAAKQNLKRFLDLAPDDPDAAAARSMMEALP